jgi:hypothetical protein
MKLYGTYGAFMSVFSENFVTPSDGINKYHFDPIKNKYKFEMGKNSKLGKKIAVWSTLMGDYIYKRLKGVLTGIKGTCTNCGACKGSCYVRHGYEMRPAEILNHAKNTWGLRNQLDKVASDLSRQLSRGRIGVVRINSSGEVENAEQLSMWCELAHAYGEVKFYVYTKNYKLATKFLKGGLVPTNMVILFSVWGTHGVKEFNSVKHLDNVKAFVFDDGNLKVQPQVYCPTYHEKYKTSDKYKRDAKHTCDNCKLCFSGKIKVIACHNH